MANPATVAHGPGLLGTLFNVFLYGIMVTQCFLYYSRYPNDKLWMKALVFLLLIADSLNCAFDIWWIYDIVINHFGDFGALETGNWVFATDPAMVGTIATIVQLFFAWRVKTLTGNRVSVAIITITAFASIIGGIGTAIYIHFIPHFVDFQQFQAIVIVWLICAAVCDVTITISLTWHLRKHRTGFSSTDDVLNKIIKLTVQNGLITAVWAIIDLVAFLATSTGLHLLFNFPLAKLYTNSMMSSLNSRASWRFPASRDTDKGNHTKTSDSGSRRPDVLNLSAVPRQEVFISVESHEMVDVSQKSDIEWSQKSDRSHPSSVKQPIDHI